MSPVKVDFFGALALFVQNTFNFKGRSTMSEYWWIALVNILFYTLLYYNLKNYQITHHMNPLVVSVCLGYFLVTLIPNLSLTVRRLHDTGKAWYWIFSTFIPCIGGLALTVLLAMPGEKKANQWGPPAESPDNDPNNIFAK